MEHATGPTRWILLTFSIIIVWQVIRAQRGHRPFIRRIPGLTAIDEAVGRAVEMGRPILSSVGLGGIDIVTLQALAIVTNVAAVAARFGSRLLLPVRNAALVPVAEDAIRNAYNAAGRPDAFHEEDILFLSGEQFAYAAGIAGIIQRERVAATFLFGTFFAESLIIAENANQVGAIQVAGTPSTTQIPFFIVSCDYVIIGDEFYGATAYLTRQPTLMGSLAGQDLVKGLLLALILVGAVLLTANVPVVRNLFSDRDLASLAAYFLPTPEGR
ncbi:MAG: DUF6754 domain-containing protein [Capsulimonadales bacterium]|nr:DUF6754 domain-containing protein [Capsulimonadales bacterium]